MKILLANKDGTALFTNMDSPCFECARNAELAKTETVDCLHDGSKRRRRLELTDRGQLYICCPNEEVASKRVFKRVYDLVRSILPSVDVLRDRLDESSRSRSSRLVHNLKTLNAMNTQEFFAIAPQHRLSRLSYREQVDEVERLIAEDPRKAAKAILRMHKNNIASKCEFGSFEKFSVDNPKLDVQLHDIRRVLLNILHPFFSDFTDKGIYVDPKLCTDQVPLDYETFQVAVFHLVDNAAKYTAPDSPFQIYFERGGNCYVVSFEMTSLAISDLDAERMFADGFSGDGSRSLGKAGDGLGLGIVKKLLEFNNASLEVKRNLDPTMIVVSAGQRYERNAFRIRIRL